MKCLCHQNYNCDVEVFATSKCPRGCWQPAGERQSFFREISRKKVQSIKMKLIILIALVFCGHLAASLSIPCLVLAKTKLCERFRSGSRSCNNDINTIAVYDEKADCVSFNTDHPAISKNFTRLLNPSEQIPIE